jgi:hypothetical protein
VSPHVELVPPDPDDDCPELAIRDAAGRVTYVERPRGDA